MGRQFELAVPGVVLVVARAVASRFPRLVVMKRVPRLVAVKRVGQLPVGAVVGDCQGGAHVDVRWLAIHLVQW